MMELKGSERGSLTLDWLGVETALMTELGDTS